MPYLAKSSNVADAGISPISLEDTRLPGGRECLRGQDPRREAKRQPIPRSHSLREAADAPDPLLQMPLAMRCLCIW